MKSAVHAALCAGALVSCVHWRPTPSGPEDAARAYADALEQGRVDAAFALSSGVDLARFKACYADPMVRARRVAEVRAAAGGQPSAGASLRLVVDSGSWRVQELEPARPAVQEQAADALARFLDAADRGDFDSALKLLAPSWRARYSAQRLRDDFEHEPLAKERIARARTALQSAVWIIAADGAQLPLGAGKAVRLSREGDDYRLVALE